MTEQFEDDREIARERMRDMPGETAAGRVDPNTFPKDEREELARRVPRSDEEDADAR